VSLSLIFPTICVHMWSVSRVSLHASNGNAGHASASECFPTGNVAFFASDVGMKLLPSLRLNEALNECEDRVSATVRQPLSIASACLWLGQYFSFAS
jgi:hypothetical protein